MPEISVIIPVYNKEKYIKNTLKSVLRQDFTDYEIIIIDDGSTDRSIEIIKELNLPDIQIIQQANQGVAVARNKGAEMATGKILSFLDADDLWLPNHLSEIKKLSENFKEAAFFATAYQIKYQNGLKDFVYKFTPSYQLLSQYYQYSYRFPLFFTSNFAVKKDIFQQTGGFKTGIDAEDTEYFLRLGAQYALGYATKITMIHIHKAENSLFAKYNTDNKIKILKNFSSLEKKDQKLKKYLDINRYVWSIEYLSNGQKKKAERIINDIDFKNLNYKQKFLLRLSGKQLIFLKKIQNFLLKRGIRISIQS